MKKFEDRLKGMTKEEKLRLYDVIQEKKRRLKDRSAVYTPNDGQMPVHMSSVKEKYVLAGNGGGKTALGVNEAIWAAKGYHPYKKVFTKVPCKVIVVLTESDKVTESWMPEIRKWENIEEKQEHRLGRPYIKEVSFLNGSAIYFMFQEQPLKAFESIEADVVIFDEPFPKPIFTALKRGLRKKHTKPWILFIGTLINDSWIRRDKYLPWKKGEGKKHVECFQFDSSVNRTNQAEDWYEWFFGDLSTEERRIRERGNEGGLRGLALAHLFDSEHHIIDTKELLYNWNYEKYPCCIVIDPHPSKPHYAVLLGVDEFNYIYVIDEYQRKCTASQFMEDLINEKKWLITFRIVDIVYDSLGNAENTSGEGFEPFGKKINEVLSLYSMGRARATTYKEKSDEDFIERIKESMLIPLQLHRKAKAYPKIRFASQCTGVVSNVENVCWLQDKYREMNKPKLDLGNKDYLVCVKYGLATNLYFKKGLNRAVRRSPIPKGYLGNRSKQHSRIRRMKLNLRSMR